MHSRQCMSNMGCSAACDYLVMKIVPDALEPPSAFQILARWRVVIREQDERGAKKKYNSEACA